MARPPEPLEMAKLKGAVKLNPQRYRNVPSGREGDIGDPPAHMKSSAKAVWYELLETVPPGIVTTSERILLETAANLIVEYRSDPESFSSARHGVLDRKLAELGMGPASRRKLATPSQPKENEFAKFLTRQ